MRGSDQALRYHVSFQILVWGCALLLYPLQEERKLDCTDRTAVKKVFGGWKTCFYKWRSVCYKYAPPHPARPRECSHNTDVWHNTNFTTLLELKLHQSNTKLSSAHHKEWSKRRVAKNTSCVNGGEIKDGQSHELRDSCAPVATLHENTELLVESRCCSIGLLLEQPDRWLFIWRLFLLEQMLFSR